MARYLARSPVHAALSVDFLKNPAQARPSRARLHRACFHRARSRAQRLTFFGLTTASILLAGSAAFAQDDVAKAAVLSREAEKLMADGNTAAACPKYAESQQLDPRAATAMDLGICFEKDGKPASALRAYEQAQALAQKEKRADRAAEAKKKMAQLGLKVGKLTINVAEKVEGMKVLAGGEVVPDSAIGQPFAVNPGEVVVVVTAPGKKNWEGKASVRATERKTLAVPALVAGEPAPVEPEVKPPPETKPPEDVPEDKPKETPTEDPKPKTPGKRESGRFVFDVGIMVGFLQANLYETELDGVRGTQYSYFVADGNQVNEVLASCGATDIVPGAGDCVATFDPASNFLVGGQFFVGYGFTPSVQFGGRGIAAAAISPNGLGGFFAGGPAVSFEVAHPLWLGVAFLVGHTRTESFVTGALGSVPEEHVTTSGGEEIEIARRDLTLQSDVEYDTADGFVMLGGNLEISMVLTEWDVGGSASGSLMMSAWPTMMGMVTGGGYAIAVPVGIGARFY